MTRSTVLAERGGWLRAAGGLRRHERAGRRRGAGARRRQHPRPHQEQNAELGRQHKTAQALYEALKAEAKGGQPLAWAAMPDWSGVYSRPADKGFTFDPDLPAGVLTTAKLTPEYQAKLEKRVADVKKGIEWDPDLHVRAARAPALADRAVPARVHRHAEPDVADQRDGERRPARLHRRARPRARGGSLSAVQRRLDRLLGRRQAGGAHQPADGRASTSARTPTTPSRSRPWRSGARPTTRR